VLQLSVCKNKVGLSLFKLYYSFKPRICVTVAQWHFRATTKVGRWNRDDRGYC